MSAAPKSSSGSSAAGGWEVVIGLETHAQLSTASKIFSGASTAFGAEPNTQASVVDLALPRELTMLWGGEVRREEGEGGKRRGRSTAPRELDPGKQSPADRHAPKC